MTNIFVGSLSFKTTEEELRKEFEAFGEVSSDKIIARSRAVKGAEAGTVSLLPGVGHRTIRIPIFTTARTEGAAPPAVEEGAGAAPGGDRAGAGVPIDPRGKLDRLPRRSRKAVFWDNIDSTPKVCTFQRCRSRPG